VGLEGIYPPKVKGGFRGDLSPTNKRGVRGIYPPL